ncbi:MAG: NAD(P)H-dependent oxidoreductase [Woeseiaceae bacterium]|nr:NAD(P)H-dependent oxidoreductase [Woeseiaceae bacterium]
MPKALIINAHSPSAFSSGRLNSSLVEKANDLLQQKGYELRNVNLLEDWDTEEQLDNHQWADVTLLQSPVNWMGVSWRFKQYMDDVYSAGMAGQLCDGDGRTRSDPGKQYGSGGTLTGKKYMLSLTFNAPRDAFDDEDQYLFQGKGVDDLFFPMHMNFRFFDMEPLETFVCYDVLKNPDVENDFVRFEEHIAKHF